MTRLRRYLSLSAVALLLAGCAWRVDGGGVVNTAGGDPAGRATMVIEEKSGWPTPLATVTLPDGETFTGKVITEASEPRVGYGVGTGVGFGWGSRSGVGLGTSVLLSGAERTSRASALLLSGAGHSMRCDIRTVRPGVIRSGGFADCSISDGRTLALEF